jgi:transcriptional regulator with XRE-family HTH domain
MTNVDIGGNIAKVRAILSLSPSEASVLLHKSINWLANRELSKVEITTFDLFYMAEAWKVTMDAFFNPSILLRDIANAATSIPRGHP